MPHFLEVNLIVFQTDRFIIVEKPAGLFVHGSKEDRDADTLLRKLRVSAGLWTYPVHRLDRATSGLVVLSLRPEDVFGLQSALKLGEKYYVAGVFGQTPESGEITHPLTNEKGVRRECLTLFWKTGAIRCFGEEYGSLLKVQIKTGRQHQIRRHMSHIKHHILGDTTYGKGRINQPLRAKYGLLRLFLHASELRFVDPFSQKPIEIVSSLPPDLRRFLDSAITDSL